LLQKYEYKFVRLGEGWWVVKKPAIERQQQVIHKHAEQGWRSVQIFAPALAAYGSAKYFELIFEREIG